MRFALVGHEGAMSFARRVMAPRIGEFLRSVRSLPRSLGPDARS
jgi:hypothetical protein